MITYKYKPHDRVILRDGRTGTIQEREQSMVDNQVIPSYWVVFSKRVFPDGCARNTYESSISGIAPPKKRSIIARIFKSK